MNITSERLYPMPSTRVEVCGHCPELSVWHIETIDDKFGVWNDYECDVHAKQWWPTLFPAREVTPWVINNDVTDV
jgi:hypothetical protein